ncbi:MAG: DNA-directed RNA polymerase subunit alpha C-terminal domain-containing protein [Planctomycetota bacterium]|jgi:hypothetical protein
MPKKSEIKNRLPVYLVNKFVRLAAIDNLPDGYQVDANYDYAFNVYYDYRIVFTESGFAIYRKMCDDEKLRLGLIQIEGDQKRRIPIHKLSQLMSQDPLELLDRKPGLTVRASNCLRAARIKTIGELIEHRPRDLLKYRNVGTATLLYLVKGLSDYGLYLRSDSLPPVDRLKPVLWRHRI